MGEERYIPLGSDKSSLPVSCQYHCCFSSRKEPCESRIVERVSHHTRRHTREFSIRHCDLFYVDVLEYSRLQSGMKDKFMCREEFYVTETTRYRTAK